jgi:hypothetical protein
MLQRYLDPTHLGIHYNVVINVAEFFFKIKNKIKMLGEATLFTRVLLPPRKKKM